MEILKYGIPPDQKEYAVECRKCKSHLRFKAFETVYHFDQRNGDYLSIPCPVCGRHVTCQP